MILLIAQHAVSPIHGRFRVKCRANNTGITRDSKSGLAWSQPHVEQENAYSIVKGRLFMYGTGGTAVSDNKNNSTKQGVNVVTALLGLIAICLCGAMFAQAANDVNKDLTAAQAEKAKPIDQLDPAPPFALFVENVDSMTDAQWENWVDNEVKNTAVTDWVGTVSQVDKGEISGDYTVLVVMPDRRGADVYIDVPEDLALALNLDDKIRFSGRVRGADNSFGLAIYMKDATIETITD